MKTICKVSSFRNIFPSSKDDYSVKEEDLFCDSEEGEEEKYPERVAQIYSSSDNATMCKIIESLNQYLVKNRGAASDFHLMKDVVERNINAQEEYIAIQQPIPLYLGLMGTMVGIIVGISYLAFSGGASTEFFNQINPLMTCISIAMFSSLFGVLCTTIISWKSKNAKAVVESLRNEFYSWLQTELLPTLSGNTASALSLLQNNLAEFNTSFKKNINGLDIALSKVGQVSQNQADLISEINKLDVKKISEANIRVLSDLQSCTGKLETFNQYMLNVTTYLSAVQSLNASIGSSYNRTSAIEKMAIFFEEELSQINERKLLIKNQVGEVDVVLRKTFEALSDSMNNSLTELRNNSTENTLLLSNTFEGQQQIFQEQLNKQQLTFSESLNEQQSALLEAIKHNHSDLITALNNQQTSLMDALKIQQETFDAKSSELSIVIEAIKNLAETNENILSLTKITQIGNDKIDSLSNSIQMLAISIDMKVSRSGRVTPRIKPMTSKILIICAISAVVLIGLLTGLVMYYFINNLFNH